jgi:hypothetical protein
MYPLRHAHQKIEKEEKGPLTHRAKVTQNGHVQGLADSRKDTSFLIIDLALAPNCKYDILGLIDPVLTTAKLRVCTHKGFDQHAENDPNTSSSSTLLHHLHNHPDPENFISQLNFA